MTSVWNFPCRVVYGEGAVEQLAREIARLRGTRVLVVTDRGVRAKGVLGRVQELLEGARIPFEVFDEVVTNPAELQVDAAAALCRASEADVIVALGGGASIDTAKLARLSVCGKAPWKNFADTAADTMAVSFTTSTTSSVAVSSEVKLTQPVHPIARVIAIPTTAGTGSEVTSRATLTLDPTKKVTLDVPRLMPDVAILDPVLTRSLPHGLTAATGFEALTHNIEAYCARGDHPMADAIALEAIGLIHSFFERAVLDGGDLDARGGMQKAAMMGGVASQKGLGVCRSLGSPVSLTTDTHYGVVSSLCLPAVLDFNRSAVPVKVAKIARILGVRADDIETLAFECSGAVRALRRKVGLPDGLSEIGLAEPDVPRLAVLAEQDPSHQTNPRACTVQDLEALYRASL
jgi:4-hydroxybutyrate dehydrogenase